MSKKISTLAVGAKVRDPLSKYYGVPVGFQIADKNHAGYPANSTTLAAEKILCPVSYTHLTLPTIRLV